jgi:thiol-disulfide isomerase/thioredoxin
LPPLNLITFKIKHMIIQACSKNKLFILSLSIVCFFTSLHAQVGKSSSSPTPINLQTYFSSESNRQYLNIGETAPDIEFTVINYPSRKMCLSDFRGKLVILDFFATWCTSCLPQFPILDSFQKRNPNLQVILVNSINTGDNELKLKEFVEKRNKIKRNSFDLPIAIDDSVGLKLFPHHEVPHYVWIAPNGTVAAITNSKQITEENITAIINENSPNLPVKKDFSGNTPMDLPSDYMNFNDDFPFYSLFKRGKLEGLTRINVPRLFEIAPEKAVNGSYYTRGYTLRNVSLLEMYETAIHQNPKFITAYNKKRLLLDLTNTIELIYDSTQLEKSVWEKRNLYTYDLLIPRNEIDSLSNYMLRDINHYSGYYGRIEKREVKCLVLVRTSKIDKLKSKGGKAEYLIYDEEPRKYMRNMNLQRFVISLNYSFDCIKVPVIDETNYLETVDLELSVNLNDFKAVRNALNKYDLDLKETTRILDMFVISKK